MPSARSLSRREAEKLGLAWLAVAASAGCATSDEITPPDVLATTTPATDELALRDQLRRLWSDEVVGMRGLVIDSVAELPDANYATQRLLRTQVELGRAIEPFYGEARGNELGSLLYLHVSIGSEVLEAAKARDEDALGDARTRWFTNADLIATFLSSIDSWWTADELERALHDYLGATLREIEGRVAGEARRDLGAYDALASLANLVADQWSRGIAAQRPDLVSPTVVSPAEASLHVEMRDRWGALASLSRFYLVEALAELTTANVTLARLLEVPDAIARSIEGHVGARPAAAVARLLAGQIDLLASLVHDTANGRRRARDERLWFANAASLGARLSAFDPSGNRAAWQRMTRDVAERTLVEIDARVEERWSDDLAAFDAVRDDAAAWADSLTDVIAPLGGPVVP